MESNINQARQLLEEEIQELHIQIDQLTGKRDIILNVIKSFECFSNGTPAVKKVAVKPGKEKVSTPKQSKAPSPKKKSDGLERFGTYMINIFRSNPEKRYTNKLLQPIMQKAIDNNKVDPGNGRKDLASTIASNLYNCTSRGELNKFDEDGVTFYEYNHSFKGGKFASSGPKELEERTVLEESILEHLRVNSNKTYTAVIITSAVRAGGNYVEIARDLSGTLQTAVEKSLRKLVAMDLVRIDGNEYYINQQKM